MPSAPPVSEGDVVPAAVSAEGEPEGNAILLFGESGSGKTYALTTLIEAGLDLFVLGTEPRFLESLRQAVIDRGLDMNKLHTAHVYPATASWEAMIKSAEVIAQSSYADLTSIKTWTNKVAYGKPWVDIMRTMNDFVDERTGKHYGPIHLFDPETQAFAIDSTTGLAYMAMDNSVGGKPVRHEGEWGVAMDNLERFNNACTARIRCFFVMTGHVEKEPDPMGGVAQAYVSTLGRKLSPKWGRFYSEVVLSYREKDKFYWSTATPMYSLKRRSLPLSDKINPSFVPIVEAWRARKKGEKL
jgi:hypothetical protein